MREVRVADTAEGAAKCFSRLTSRGHGGAHLMGAHWRLVLT